MPAPRPLILIHIPKTAGTTLSRMLRLRLALWPPPRWVRHARTLGYYHLGYARPEHLQARFQRIAALAPAQQRQIEFFAAHAGFGLRERLPQPIRESAAYLVVLRDPVARFVSTFRHLRSERRLPADATLADYVRMHRHFGLFKFDNAQTRYLAGENGVAVDAPPGAVTRDMLHRAMQRLERDMWWFGLTERFDESVLMLADALGWSRPRYVPARVSKPAREGPAQAERDGALLEEIRAHNALDHELHGHALRLFEQRLALTPQPADFAERLARFRRRNARLAAATSPIVDLLPGLRRIAQRAGLLR